MPASMVSKYQSFIWSNAQFGLIGIFIAWQVFDRLFDPIFTFAISLLYPGVSYS
jgi:hypothetical protein